MSKAGRNGLVPAEWPEGLAALWEAAEAAWAGRLAEGAGERAVHAEGCWWFPRKDGKWESELFPDPATGKPVSRVTGHAPEPEPPTGDVRSVPLECGLVFQSRWTRPWFDGGLAVGFKYRLVEDEGAAKPLPVEDVAALLTMDLTTDWLVKDVVVAEQLCVIAGAIKTLKTSVAFDLVMSLCFKKPFLGVFGVPAEVRAGIFLGETTKKAVGKMLKAMCWAKDIPEDEVPGKLVLSRQLPKPAKEGGLEVIDVTVRKYRLVLAAFDPFYLMGLAGTKDVNAANLFQMGPLVASIAETCLGAGCTPVIVTHNTKEASRAYGMPEIHDITMSGIPEQAAQWILLGRKSAMKEKPHRILANIGGREGHFCQKTLVIDDGTADAKRWDVKVYDYDEDEEQQARSGARERKQEAARDEKAREKLEQIRGLDTGSGISKEEVKRGLPASGEVVSDLLNRWAHHEWIEVLDGKQVTERGMRFRVRIGQIGQIIGQSDVSDRSDIGHSDTLPPKGGRVVSEVSDCPIEVSSERPKEQTKTRRPPPGKKAAPRKRKR
jgi:hypothetical protein